MSERYRTDANEEDPVTLTTADLRNEHLYKTVRIDGPDWSITGRLTVVHHEAEVEDITTSAPFTSEPKVVRTSVRPSVTLTVGPFKFCAKGTEKVTLP